MSKRRIFIAINLPKNIKDKLISYREKWTDLPVRWTPTANIHITLAFIGHVDDDETYEICKVVKKIASIHNPFTINLEKIILGPPNKPPRMLWVEGEKNKELAEFKDALESSLLDSQSNGYEKKEIRAFCPHITLGRIKQGLWQKLVPQPEINEIFNFSFQVETIEIMQSNLKRSGAEYSILETIELGV